MLKKSLLVLVLFPVYFYGQITFKGTVKDSINAPLEYVNIVATDFDKSTMEAFAISDDKGRYRFKLKKHKKYILEVSFVGYGSIFDTIVTTKKNIIKNYILKEKDNVLEVVNIELPVYMRNDTTFYKVSKFVNGKERKLKNVLRKLPGIKVSRNGDVTVNGKKVTTMLVDNKPFFGGGSKLAVDNIPADAIKGVQALENYNAVGFLKKVNDSDELALNIELKKDKNKFIFGDIEPGKGQQEYYKFNSGLFRYAPNSTAGLIVNLNNVGEQTLSKDDYKRFAGKSNNIFASDSDISGFSAPTDVYKTEKQFAAVNISSTISKKLELSGYLIFSDDKSNSLSENTNNYSNFVEETNKNTRTKNRLGISKLRINYHTSDKNIWRLKTLFKRNQVTRNTNVVSTISLNENRINTTYNDVKDLASQEIEWHNNTSVNDVFSGLIKFNYEKLVPKTIWETNIPLLKNLQPIIIQNEYKLFNQNYSKRYSLDSQFKYFRLIKKHQLHFSISNLYKYEYKSSSDGQIVSNKKNDFDGFGNDFKLGFHKIIIGISHQYKAEKWLLKYGADFNRLHWSFLNENDQKVDRTKYLCLPNFNFTYDFTKKTNLSIGYRFNNRFPNTENFLSRKSLTSYQSIFRGNPYLENLPNHNISLNFHKMNLYRGLIFMFMNNYSKQQKGIASIVKFDATNRFNSVTMVNNPSESFSSNVYVSKMIDNFNFNVNTSYNNSFFKQEIDNNFTVNNSVNYTNSISVETFFDKLPSIHLGISQRRSVYKNLNNKSEFISTEPKLGIIYDFLKYYQFTFDYSYQQQKSINAFDTYQIAETSFYYHKESSPWIFRFSIKNLFDTKFKQKNTFSNYSITDTKRYLLPRVGLFSVNYKI